MVDSLSRSALFHSGPPSRALVGLPVIVTSAIVACLISSSSGCTNGQRSIKSVKFQVWLSEPRADQRVYLTGTGKTLGEWNPAGVPLSRESDSLWSAVLSFPEGEKIEYKITAGSWWTEALDSARKIYPNFRLEVDHDTTVRVDVYDWLGRSVKWVPVVDSERLSPGHPALLFDGPWRYHAGDDTSWAAMRCDDSEWASVDSRTLATGGSRPEWKSVGWFRFHFIADTSIWGTTIALTIGQMGASEVYYNGRLLYSFGRIGGGGMPVSAMEGRLWKKMRIDPVRDQVIAVRYANPDWSSQEGQGFDPGFLIILDDLNSAFRQTLEGTRAQAIQQAVFTLIPLVLFFVHLILYVFYRKQRQNLFYAFCLLGFAGITYFNVEPFVTADPDLIVLYTRLGGISGVVAIFFGLLTIYSTAYMRMPRRWWTFFVLFLLVIGVGLLRFTFDVKGIVFYSYFGFSMIDGIISSVRGDASRRGTALLLGGYILLDAFILLQILTDYGFIPAPFPGERLYVYGMLSLAVAMSMYLSYNFAWVNRDLERQLQNVRLLSEKSLEQERLASKLELERRMIELENERKSKELESARDLQLSLLPRDVPHVEGLDVACFMRTASEVGGDYYDFPESGEGELTVVVGDATGHGLRAGTMVMATKGLMNVLAGTDGLDSMMTTANKAVKRMNLHALTMCLAIARIRRHGLSYTSAGMPPLLIYRKEQMQCEQLILKAMPLGAVTDFPYSKAQAPLCSGDIVAMVSDGLLELFNGQGETYGMENIADSLKRNAGKSAGEIVQSLYADGMAWSGERPLADDLTMVVVKVL